jgi:adenosine deaminase
MTHPDRFDLAPKVELHLHLEGAIPLETVWQLITRHGGDPDVPDIAALRRRLAYTDFADFIATWSWMIGFLQTYEDFTLIAESVATRLVEQHIVYAEASFSPTDFARHGLTPQGLAVAIRTGIDRVPAARVVLNCDLVRDAGPERGARTLASILEVAESAGIRGITIGGSEHEFPARQFAGVFATAATAGLHLTAHAGEAAGPDSIRSALDDLGVARIGHGVRAVEDEELLERLVAEQIPLEVCPTSNVATGVASGWETHPLWTLLDRGANVTISTDDPTYFHTSLAAEFRHLASRLGGDGRMHELTRRAVTASWMTPGEQEDTIARIDSWWASVS